MSSHNGAVAPSEFPPPVDSTREFIKRELDAEDERLDVGVAIVGGGTAGLATANRLLQLVGDDPALAESFGEVRKEAVYLTPTAKRAIRIPVPPPFKNHGNEVVSVAALARFQQDRAEE